MPCDQLCHEITVPPSFCCLISPLLSLLICEIHLITLVNFTEVSWSLIKFWKGCQELLAECSEEVSRWEMDTREGNVLHRVWVSRMGWSCPLTGTVTLSGHCHELWGHPCWGATSTNIHFPLSWDLSVLPPFYSQTADLERGMPSSVLCMGTQNTQLHFLTEPWQSQVAENSPILFFSLFLRAV